MRSALEALVDPTTRGDPENPLRWTCLSTRQLAATPHRVLSNWPSNGGSPVG
ncbi:MAG TPA: hypothetical protein DCQ94_22180 [Nitrospira sp.]|nr:hypothetical protein [Nitrospira sp.]